MTIKESYMSGIIPPDLKIIDAHAHVGKTAGVHIPLDSMDEGLRRMKALGITAMCGSHLAALGGELVSGNRLMFDLAEQYPGVVYAHVVYDPRTPELSLGEILKYENHPGYVGVKIHPREHYTSLTSDGYRLLWEHADLNRTVVTCHTWETEPMNDPALYFDISECYPNMISILAHCGGTYRGYETCYRLVREFPNIYIDMNGFIYGCQWIEQAVEKFGGVERLVFGTDQYFNDPRTSLGRVIYSTLTDEQMRTIFYDNYAALCGKF